MLSTTSIRLLTAPTTWDEVLCITKRGYKHTLRAHAWYTVSVFLYDRFLDFLWFGQERRPNYEIKQQFSSRSVTLEKFSSGLPRLWTTFFVLPPDSDQIWMRVGRGILSHPCNLSVSTRAAVRDGRVVRYYPATHTLPPTHPYHLSH